MRVRLIANLRASGTTVDRVAAAALALGASHEVAVAETAHAGHARELAADAVADGVDAVAVLGGDGTLNEAANGVLGTDCLLVPLPGGSTNVFARNIGVPRSFDDALSSTVDALDRGRVRSVGVGVAGGRAFLAHVGAGFDAGVVARADARPDRKRRFGQAWFVGAAVATWGAGRRRFPELALELPDGHTLALGPFAVALNSDPYTYLGARGLHVAPDAALDRPLDVIGILDLRLVPLLRVAASALRSGPSAFAGRDDIVHTSGVTAARLVADRPFPYQLDGDHLGEVTELILGWRPHALRLLA